MPVILHSDLNNFYASCECLLNPELAGLPVAVCGKMSDRHGVVLAKNYIAKKLGVTTGMTVVEARTKASNIVFVEPHHDTYLYYSKRVKDIYRRYTDKIESFGIDEAWLDVTESVKSFGDGEKLANEIRERVKEEIGLTVSIGVSFNKTFAKLGSDLKKPDAVSVVSKENYKDVVWNLPVESLLGVGRATTKKLNDIGIWTVGSLARFDIKIIKHKLGKCGEQIWNWANGEDYDPVKKDNEHEEIKSVGNSTTFYRDIDDYNDLVTLICMLSESVVARMKKYDVGYAKTLHLSLVKSDLTRYGAQSAFVNPTMSSNDLISLALDIYNKNFKGVSPIRGVGVSVSNFIKEEQMLILNMQEKRNKNEKVDKAVESLRSRFGNSSIKRGLLLLDRRYDQMQINGANITSQNLGIQPSSTHQT